MQKEKKDKHFLKKPIYPGGPDAMSAFISSSLVYPQAAIDQKISGMVQLELTISHQGEVLEAKVLHGLGYGCDEEAKRVARLLKFHVPKNRGIKVRFFKKINIHFGIKETPNIPAPLPEKTSGQGNYVYEYIPAPVSKTVVKPVVSSKPSTITFTIKLG